MVSFVKELIVKELVEQFRGLHSLVVVSTAGIKSQDMVALRAALRARQIKATTAKNSLCSLALKEVGLEGALSLLEGPSTVVYGGESIVDIAKALAQHAAVLENLKIRGGQSRDRLLSADEISALAKLPPRERMLGELVSRLTAGPARVLALLEGITGRVAGQIKKLSERPDESAKAAAETKEEAKTEPEAAAQEGEAEAKVEAEAEVEAKADDKQSGEGGPAAEQPSEQTESEAEKTGE